MWYDYAIMHPSCETTSSPTKQSTPLVPHPPPTSGHICTSTCTRESHQNHACISKAIWSQVNSNTQTSKKTMITSDRCDKDGGGVRGRGWGRVLHPRADPTYLFDLHSDWLSWVAICKFMQFNIIFKTICLKWVISRNSNCKLQINAIYDYLQIDLCARF